MKKAFAIGIIGIAFLGSCKPKETPIDIKDNLSVQSSQMKMGSEYEHQIYFSLHLNQMTGTHSKTAWDIAVINTDTANLIMLNGAKVMYAYATSSTDIAGSIDTSGYELGKQIDKADLNLDSLAIQAFQGTSPVYLIDRGFTGSSTFGKVYCQFKEIDATTIEVAVRDIFSNVVERQTIHKNMDYWSQMLSFNPGLPLLEKQPLKQDWDLIFTQYTSKIPIIYLVTGVLTQKYKIQAFLDTVTNFEAIDAAHAASLDFNYGVDNIGYNWKEYQFDQGSYVMLPNKVYIIKDNYYEQTYKLQFTDFYDEAGEKGNVSFRFQKL